MASWASCDSWLRNECFLRNPPPPFDCDTTAGERRKTDTDEDWLPDVQDLLSGNFNLLIDLTGDSDYEGDHESFSESPRFDPASVLPAPCSSGPEPSSFSGRPPGACQPLKAMDRLDLDQVEIPEPPSAIRARPAASVQSRHHSDGDSGTRSAAAVTTQAIIASTETDSVVKEQQEQEQEQEQEKEEQEWEETSSSGGGFPPSRQPDAPISASTIQLPESGMIPERPSPGAVRDHQLEIHIQDITFLHIEGQRETAQGPEYGFVGKMWLQPGAGVPSDLLQVYRRGSPDRIALRP